MGNALAVPVTPWDDSDLPSAGEVVADRYRIVRLLARGGMGAVFEAEHLGLARPVALKFLRCDAPESAARFVREARAAARLEGEHIVRVWDVGTHGGVPFLAMERLAGVDMHEYLEAHGRLPLGEAADYVLQACAGVAEAHSHGIVHRDLKPSNLFLARRADGSQLVKVLDFGVAKAPAHEGWSEDGLTSAVLLLGSPPYMSPEHVRDPAAVDARADVWSLGVILYELVSGRRPFEGATAMQLGARITLEPHAPVRTHVADAPEALERILARCLAKDPDERYPTVADLARDLVAFAGTRSDAAPERVEHVSLGSEPTVVASSVVPLSPCERFRRQHEELQRLGTELAASLSKKTIASEAARVRRLFARFAGKVAVHAAMENEALYPRLLAHANPAIRSTASALYDEVGQLYACVRAHAARWPSVASIEGEPGAFVDETRALLLRLATRMVRENEELYPLVDAAG